VAENAAAVRSEGASGVLFRSSSILTWKAMEHLLNRVGKRCRIATRNSQPNGWFPSSVTMRDPESPPPLNCTGISDLVIKIGRFYTKTQICVVQTSTKDIDCAIISESPALVRPYFMTPMILGEANKNWARHIHSGRVGVAIISVDERAIAASM